MHGSTLREIENSLPQPHEEIVDVLGRVLWKALIYQFPHEMFDGKLALGYPSTYLHRRLNAVAHIEAVVRVDADGYLDLSSKSVQAKLVPFGPPQSALPSIISMTPEQHERLGRVSTMKGDHQEMCQRIYERVRKQGGQVHALVLSTDMATIKDALKRGDRGPWQDLFREIIGETDWQ